MTVFKLAFGSNNVQNGCVVLPVVLTFTSVRIAKILKFS